MLEDEMSWLAGATEWDSNVSVTNEKSVPNAKRNSKKLGHCRAEPCHIASLCLMQLNTKFAVFI